MKQNKIQMRNMLIDVVKHFSQNPKQLRNRIPGCCQYAYMKEKPNSIGCAIGMYLNNDVCEKLDRIGSIDFVFKKPEKNLLPKWMQNMGNSFLSEIQCLHDREANWTETSISEEGKKEVNYIIKTFDLGEPYFKL